MLARRNPQNRLYGAPHREIRAALDLSPRVMDRAVSALAAVHAISAEPEQRGRPRAFIVADPDEIDADPYTAALPFVEAEGPIMHVTPNAAYPPAAAYLPPAADPNAEAAAAEQNGAPTHLRHKWRTLHPRREGTPKMADGYAKNGVPTAPPAPPNPRLHRSSLQNGVATTTTLPLRVRERPESPSGDVVVVAAPLSDPNRPEDPNRLAKVDARRKALILADVAEPTASELACLDGLTPASIAAAAAKCYGSGGGPGALVNVLRARIARAEIMRAAKAAAAPTLERAALDQARARHEQEERDRSAADEKARDLAAIDAWHEHCPGALASLVHRLAEFLSETARDRVRASVSGIAWDSTERVHSMARHRALRAAVAREIRAAESFEPRVVEEAPAP